MKTKSKNRFLAMLLVGALAVMTPQWVMAAGTPACTSISNQATIAFTVGGVSQTGIDSNTSSFTVGNKVNVVVVRQDATAVSVTPGATLRTLTFRVTNTGNFIQDYAITAVAKDNGTANPFGGTLTDIFNGTNLATPTATVDNLAPDAFQDVTITETIPLTVADTNIAVYTLTAATLNADGTPLTVHNGNGAVKNADGSTACTTDFVYADAAGTAGDGDNANDAKGSARSAYQVASAVISISKSSVVYSDPINGTTNPKAIPGAVIRYTLTISNAAGAAASAVLTTISDALNANLQIVSSAAGATWSVIDSTRTVTSGTLTADTNNADGLAHSVPGSPGGTLTATLTTILASQVGPPAYAAGELKAGESVNLIFDVTIQ